MIEYGGEKCLLGSLEIPDTPSTNFILVLNEDMQIGFDIFVLCNTQGAYLDNILSTAESTSSEFILQKAEDFIRQIIHTTVLNLQRDTLWNNFSHHQLYGSNMVTADELYQMCQLSTSTSLIDVDSRLKTLLDESDDLIINWFSAFSSMRQDPIFEHSLSLSLPNNDLIVHLFHFPTCDTFLIFEVNKDGKLKKSIFLTRENVLENQPDLRTLKATRIFVNWLLHWLWSSL